MLHSKREKCINTYLSVEFIHKQFNLDQRPLFENGIRVVGFFVDSNCTNTDCMLVGGEM